MNSRFARYLLLFAALWLPVQTIAAMSMPLCRHAQEQAMAAAEQAQVAMPCHEHEASVSSQASHDAGCDKCEMCQLAGASFIASAEMVAGVIETTQSYVLPATSVPPSYIAEPPQHPPRSGA